MKKFILLLVIMTLVLFACAKKEAPVEEIKVVEEEVVEVQQVVSMNFTVQGVGEVSKKLIEAAALTVNGVNEATWDIDNMNIRISGNNDVKWEEVHSAIAAAGFDTTDMKATDEAYNALPEAAKYRPLPAGKKPVQKNNAKVQDDGTIKAKRVKVQ